MQEVKAVLVDRRNFDQIAPRIIDAIAECGMLGFDIETFDEPHAGLAQFRGKDTARVFDVNRTTVAGFSLYPDGHDEAYYVNLNHADIDNRVPWHQARELLDARDPSTCALIAHNASFEMTMMSKSLGYELENVYCSMQLCVSAYGPDEYDPNRFLGAGLGEMKKLLGTASRLFHGYELGRELNPAQAQVLNQVIGKQSKASHSYNGYVYDLSYGYSLKKAVESWFGYRMATFEETLDSNEHMGWLTGEEVVSYGADDAVWAVRLFHRILRFMQETNPDAIQAYLETENPMVAVYGNLWKQGLLVNREAIARRRAEERENTAQVLRDLKKHLRQLLPFDPRPSEQLIEANEKWYAKGYARYRKLIEDFCRQPDVDDTFEMCRQAAGAVSNAWSAEEGARKPTGPNFTHYMPVRVILYDLIGAKIVKDGGKVQSDGECRGRIMERIKKWEGARAEHALKAIEALGKLASIEQRMKLYLTPYTLIADPQTDRMYPMISSRLATRRMAGSNPNPMQLAKRGESTYVRGFFKADSEDEVLVSLDWSQIELVLIGELSGDPGFAEAYGQLPYKDLHIGAAADALRIQIPEITEDLLRNLNRMTVEEIDAINPAILLNVNGEKMEPGKAKGYWRTEVGKGSNFNYWYSGALSTVGIRLGWTSDMMWKATEAYRERFAVAEKWRVNTIDSLRENGFVKLPDGHRRVRFEATNMWMDIMRQRFGSYGDQGVARFGNEVIRAVRSRAGNQGVNAIIQGTCGTLAKRSILKIEEEIRGCGYQARFKIPVHDELVYSVHRNEVVDFVKTAKAVMTNHPDIVSNLKVDCTASVGLTFEPWHEEKARVGQVELDEAPPLPFLPEVIHGGKMNDDQIVETVDWLYRQAA